MCVYVCVCVWVYVLSDLCETYNRLIFDFDGVPHLTGTLIPWLFSNARPPSHDSGSGETSELGN